MLKIRGFLPYLIVAFLNASVDLGHKITIQNVLMKSYSGDTLITLTALVNAMILLPFIFLFSTAGFLNDKYSKTQVIRVSTLAAVAISVLILFSYLLGMFKFAFFLTLILAIQSAIYSPAKYGIIKNIVGSEKLGEANGIIQALTIIAILFSSFIFSYIFESNYIKGEQNPDLILKNLYLIGIFLLALSGAEAYFARKLPFYEAQNKEAKFIAEDFVKAKYLKENLKTTFSDYNIWLAIVGLGIFWGISQVIVATFPAHYSEIFKSNNAVVVQGILAMSGIGLVIGSSIAGQMSKFHIELGIVPIGAIGIALVLMILAGATSSSTMFLCSLAFGIFGGLFIVPLNAIIQFFAPEKQTGQIMAGNNFIQNIFMVCFLFLSILLVNIWHSSTIAIFSLMALICIAGSVFSIIQLPHLFSRLVLLPLLKSNYSFNVEGITNIPQKGGVLLLGNHISWIDWLVLQVACPRAIKFVMIRSIYNKWYINWFFKIFKVIPISAAASKDAFNEIKKRLDNGEVVALFPEGHISYNGQLNEFQKGFELILKDWENPCVLPFYLRGLWGSSFSRASDYYRILTRKFGRRSIVVAFGSPIYDKDLNAESLRDKVAELSFYAWNDYLERQKPIPYHWLKQAKKNPFKEISVDSLNINLNNLQVTTAVFLLINSINKHLKNDERVGILLPSSTITAALNMALIGAGKVPVNLNYSLNAKVMEESIEKAEIKTVITSTTFLDKLNKKGLSFPLSISSKLRFLDDWNEENTKFKKLATAAQVLLLPCFVLNKLYLTPTQLNQTAVILFSSGSEGKPKGIELTHKNILANVKQISTLLNFRRNDAILNSLPSFHSFGLTVTNLMPLIEGVKMISVPDPTDAGLVGKMTARHGATIILGTATFLRLYTKSPKINPLMFQNIRIVVSGAEKLKKEVKEEFKLKFGIDICEGYGTTETAPVAAVNTPNMLDPETLKTMEYSRAGSVGKALPGTVIKIVEPETLFELKRGEEGLVLIGGSQVMKGYLNEEHKTKSVICELAGLNFYKTGDKGYIDKDGFLFITDRYSRFAKIGGEMVSLGKIEEELSRLLPENPALAVNLPDEKKGEKVVILISGEIEKEQIVAAIKKLPPIYQPSKIIRTKELPMLPTGKADYVRAKAIAAQ